jgi:galactonate dehydratase
VKITSIRSLVVHAEMRNWVFVRVDTDQSGLFGWGEATLEWKTRSVVGAIEDLAPLILGRDPRDIEKPSAWSISPNSTNCSEAAP